LSSFKSGFILIIFIRPHYILRNFTAEKSHHWRHTSSSRWTKPPEICLVVRESWAHSARRKAPAAALTHT